MMKIRVGLNQTRDINGVTANRFGDVGKNRKTRDDL